MEYVTIIIVALIVGLAVGLVSRYRSEANAERRITAAKDEANALVERVRHDCEKRIESLKAEHRQDIECQQKQWQQNFNTQVEAVKGQMRTQFEQEMKERSQTFKSENHEQMEHILKPMKQELERLQELMNRSSTSQTERISMLKQSIETLAKHDSERDKTTRDLADALKNRGKVQGDWGEQVLENILRDSGLREGEEYRKQPNERTQDGTNVRPDVVVNFPDGSMVVIDSKVSLTAYTDYVGAESEEERQAAMKANKESVWNHVVELADKRYHQHIDASVPLVLMFVPNEGSYILAMNSDPQLGIKAWNRGILIINPTNLMVVLHLISVSWQSTRQNKNVQEILQAAQRIYDKYTTFAETFATLGRQLETARGTYEKGLGQLREGKGNISSQLQGLLRLGVTRTKKLPEALMPLDEIALTDEEKT